MWRLCFFFVFVSVQFWVIASDREGCFPCLPCFHHSHLLFTYILASVPFLKALFVSFTFLVRIILKYEIHL
uniref:Secreted protein n=1 Tax=Gallus gallus TaxID=9031 RepID=A0A8V0ZUL2_CHICK